MPSWMWAAVAEPSAPMGESTSWGRKSLMGENGMLAGQVHVMSGGLFGWHSNQLALGRRLREPKKGQPFLPSAPPTPSDRWRSEAPRDPVAAQVAELVVVSRPAPSLPGPFTTAHAIQLSLRAQELPC